MARRELLIEVRTAVWTFERMLAQAQQLFKEVEDAVAASPLPEKTDRAMISRLLAQVQLEFWASRNYRARNERG